MTLDRNCRFSVIQLATRDTWNSPEIFDVGESCLGLSDEHVGLGTVSILDDTREGCHGCKRWEKAIRQITLVLFRKFGMLGEIWKWKFS